MPDYDFKQYLNQQPQQEQNPKYDFKQYIPTQPAQKQNVSIGEDVAKSGGVGLAKGAIMVAGTGGDLQSLAQKLDISDWLAQKTEAAFPGLTKFLREETAKDTKSGVGKALAGGTGDIPGTYRLPTSEQIQSAIESKTGKFYKPQTPYGEYAQTISEFLPGSLMGATGGVRGTIGAAVRYGVAPAVASETAGQFTKGSPAEPYVRAGTALLTGGAAALTHGPNSAVEALRGGMPAHVTTSSVDAASDLMREARSRGIRLTWDEALSQVEGKPVLQDVRRVVESAPQSRGTMLAATENRPQEINNAVRSELDQISPQSREPNTIGPRVGAAAEDTISDVRKAINKNDEPSYAAASTVLLTPAEMARVKGLPGYEQARNAVRSDPQLNRDVAHLPENSVGFLNEVKKQLDQMAENARSPMSEGRNMQRSAGLDRDVADLRDELTRKSKDYAQALTSQSENRAKYLDPLLNGPVGRLASKDASTKDAIRAVFDRNPLPGSEDEIGKAISAVSKRNPQAAQELVRTHAEMTFNEAARSLGTEGKQFTGAKFAIQIAGNSQQRTNLREAVRALPGGDARWQGFNKLLDVLEATGQRQQIGSKTTFNQQELEALSRGGGVVEGARTLFAPKTWATLFGEKINQWRLGRNLNELADILTSPNSGPLLKKIAGMPSTSETASLTAFRILNQVGIGARSGPERLRITPYRPDNSAQ